MCVKSRIDIVAAKKQSEKHDNKINWGSVSALYLPTEFSKDFKIKYNPQFRIL